MFGIRGNIDATIQIKTKRHLSALEMQHQQNGVLTQQNGLNMNEFLFKLLVKKAAVLCRKHVHNWLCIR